LIYQTENVIIKGTIGQAVASGSRLFSISNQKSIPPKSGGTQKTRNHQLKIENRQSKITWLNDDWALSSRQKVKHGGQARQKVEHGGQAVGSGSRLFSISNQKSQIENYSA